MNSDMLKWVITDLGIGAAIGGYILAVIKEYLPSPRELSFYLRDLLSRPALGTHLTLLLTDLEGDTDGSQTRHVRSVFLGQKGLEVIRIGKVLRINPYGVQSQAEAAAERHGHRWLKRRNADLLIWGEVAEANKVLRLWFLSREGNSIISSKIYALEKTELPKDFGEDFATQLTAVALASIQPATEQSGSYLAALLAPLLEKLEHLYGNFPPGFSSDQKANIGHSLGLAAAVIGEQTGDAGRLEQAVAAYREALREYTRERVPLNWAMTQNNLGTALQTLGERESGTARLEQAVQAYREALNIFDAANTEYYRATTQRNLDKVSSILETRNSGK